MQWQRALTRRMASSVQGRALRSLSRFGGFRLYSSSERPFEKVLIANRGEIASRVMKTCQSLGIKTVAIFSTADSQSPFVQQADEAICVGPTASNMSYMNIPAILQAIKDTGAQAVHPGYGFLSENEGFSRAIVEAGAVWLGPPPAAVAGMGDKLVSKQIAERAGVHVIPGHEAPVESLDEAFEIVKKKVTYPILLKAAAGGGGKGMRVCYNDQDLKEAWGITKAESLKFFSDDRLLIEKFVEEPHHIEFQVLSRKMVDGEIEVAVFPERECSIQRRNQKVIEESPSTLLNDETRAAMAEQVRRLCREVGYESAGTVEWLVDANQSFYFLEMNTRLQVEHPISEAICGVDIVKGMLWVGAGWGFPKEFKMNTGSPVLPFKGHAIEGRVYAEDPVRGFLPSTGPLKIYSEPSLTRNTPERYLRMDAGVKAGSNITPHYDPMISKVIYYAPTRLEAIDGLNQSLDEYVIQGVQHNARLVQSVLREPAFREGDTPTSFLKKHYPDGFDGVQLTDKEEKEFVVAAAAISAHRRELFAQPPLVGAPRGQKEVVVKMNGLFGDAYKVDLGEGSATVSMFVDGSWEETSETIRLDGRVPLQYEPEKYLAHVSLDGKCRSIQVIEESTMDELHLQMYGAVRHVVIQSLREHELSLHMHKPVVADTSNLVMSPMPGTLISYAVEEGVVVQEGQELCIVEAMKMQNIIRSPRAGTISVCRVKVGASLKADEVIIEYESAASVEVAA